jgi:glycosyltransferase involved in cell wall biosynthesis
VNTLFITYDGLLDPLGGSQILPYLKSISSHPRSLHILSFEKADRYAQGAERLRSELLEIDISWTPLSFTTRLGKLGKLWDLTRMYLNSIRLQRRHHFTIVHCRSYQAMQIGCLLKRLFGTKTLFDMRGLWVDERMDGGIWNKDSWLDRLAYALYKLIEVRLLACSDHVIALTERVVPELRRLSPNMTEKVSVIPCCADFDHFTIPSSVERYSVRKELEIPNDARVIGYLGSLGTWYMLQEMLNFFAFAQAKWGNVHLLLITRDWKVEHEALVAKLGLSPIRIRIHVRPASRSEVPSLLGCADVMLSFIKPAYSKIASSPTKLAEAFAVGVPVLSNSGIGDVDQITHALDAGDTLDLCNADSINNAVIRLGTIETKGGDRLRTRARAILGLEVATEKYRCIYQELEQSS